MANNGAAAVVRKLITAAGMAPAAEVKARPKLPFSSTKTNLKPLFHRLSVLRLDPEGSVAATMEGLLKKRRATSEMGLINIVRELRKYKHYKQGLELMDWMEMRGMKMSASTSAVRLDLVAKVMGIDFAESYFSRLPDSEKDLKTYAALLNCYCHMRMEDKAIALYDRMKELNCISGSNVYNSLMTLYLKLGHPAKVQALFREMEANNTSPDLCSYNILIGSYASLNDIDSVEKVTQEMLNGGVTLDWTSYANLAGVYNSSGLYEKAESALKKVEELMERWNRVSFHFLITLYAGAGNAAAVKRVWKSLKTTFPKSSNNSYYVMLHALSKLDDMGALRQCFEEWESDNVFYDIKLVNVMVGAYLRKDMMEEAKSLVRKATEMGVSSNILTHELFMDYYLKRREMDLALECFDAAVSQVKQSPWKPGKEKLTAFVKYFQEVKDEDGVEAFCKSLRKLNNLDGDAYDSLLRTYLIAGEKDPSVNKQTKEDRVTLSSECEVYRNSLYS